MFTVSLTYGSIVSFLPIFATKQGIVNPGIFFSVFAITLIAVRAIAGKISDVRGRKFVIAPGMLLIILGLWVLSSADSLQTFLISAVFYGLGFGAVQPALMALLVDKIDEKGRGAAMGTFTASFDLGIGVGSILLGLVLQYTSFQILYLTGALCVFLAMVWFMRGRRDS
jgi:MFS family permease